MSLAKALTNDLERQIRSYRVPIMTALGFSFRLFNEDRFLITDSRQVDQRRGIINLDRVSQIRRLMTKLGQGVDDRTFIDMGGTLLFNGVPNEDESQIVPVQNVTIVGGRDDALDVVFTHTGTEEDKLAKVRRYTARKPEEINWRIRTPVMMAPETTVIDYLAFRCSKLPFVHSVALKWSDRRWDPRRTPIAEDIYRPEGEDSHMVILAPVWMDESMTRIDPEIWGGYEPIVNFNYDEYLGRRDDEYRQDLMAFDRCYGVYAQIIDSYSQCVFFNQDPGEFLGMSQEEQNRALVGRVQQRLNTVANRTLHIPFDRKLRSGDYTYKSVAYDQTDGDDVTEDVFNFREVDGTIAYSSGWLSDDLETDGWFHFGEGMASRMMPIDPDDQLFFDALPPVTTDFAGEDVNATHFMRLEGGRIARRMVLPDGRFLFDFWAKIPDHDERLSYNIEIIRNTRLETKKAFINAASRVQTIEHFREAYETVAVARLPSTGGTWEQMSISFKLVDHFFVQNESYPAHEVFVVITVNEENNIQSPEPEVVPFDMGPMSLWRDEFDHNIELINTAQRYRFSNLLPEQDRLVKLENAFRDDEVFQGIETAFNQCRLDGQNMCVVADHRLGYNLRQTGTSINTWLKMNSEEEAEQEVLARRGSFALFQKTGTNLAQYTSQVNGDRSVSLQFFSSAIQDITDGQHSVNSSTYRNHLLDPIVGFTGFDRLRIPWPTVPGLIPGAWPEPTLLDNYRQSFRVTGSQPREWIREVPEAMDMDLVVVPVEELVDIGKSKTVRVQIDDPYIAWGAVDGSFSAETWWQGWMDMDDDAWNVGGNFFLPDGTPVNIGPGTHVILWRCLEYHARLAYSYETEDLLQAQNFGFDYKPESQTGYVFAPVSSNRYLLETPDNYGMYQISPDAWSPRYSPDSSPGALGETLPFPVSPCDWGSEWPRSSPSPFDPNPVGEPSESPYAGVENPFSPWGWNKSGQNLDPLFRTYPVFLAGRIEFDRWFNWSIAFEPEAVRFSVNGLEVVEYLPPEVDNVVYPFDFNDNDPLQKNTADLWIGTTNPNDTNSCSPISLYSFKIFQRAVTERETLAIYGDEGINFNDYQYNLYGDYLDHDLDRQLDFWQDDLTDFTIGTIPIETPYAVSPQISPAFSPEVSPSFSPATMPFPRDLTKRYGQTVMLSGDSITIPSVVDRDFNILDDTLDLAYIEELIEIQRNGWSDGLLFWDFYHEDQEPIHGFDTRSFTQCVGYENGRLDYKPWLLDRIGNEFTSIRAVTDIIPYLEDVGGSPTGSPGGSPGSPASSPGSPADGLTTNWPTWGDDEDELLLSGIKGWFGLSDVMGYRDSLAKLQAEGLIFNYLQVEVRFRADRATLEAHLKDYAQDYDDIFFDRYEGNRLRVSIRQSATDSAS